MMKKFSAGLITVLSLFANGCASSEALLLSAVYELSSPGIPWRDPHKIKSYNFIIYADPAITADQLQKTADTALFHQEYLRRYFFRNWKKKEIRIVVFKDYESYAANKPTPLDTYAHYEGLSRTIYIPSDSPPQIWKHELLHAVLETSRPGSPYWLHEGLAYFLQSQSFPHAPDCSRRIHASAPPGFSIFLEDLRKREDLRPGSGFDLFKKGEAEMNAVLSTYFIYFLWSKGLLQYSLQKYLTQRKVSMEFILTGGNAENWKELSDEFRVWLKSDEPLKSLPGC